MIRSLRRVFFFFSLGLILLMTLPGSYAQCPQRYLDPVFTKVKPKLDIIYDGNKLNTDGTRTWLAFDVYEPDGDTAQLRPLVMLIHGGGFTNWPPINRKSPDIVELAKDLAKRGYVVISPEYRLFSGDATNEKMTETAVAAALDINTLMCTLATSVGNGNPYRIDTSKFFMGGSSAGAALTLCFGMFVDDTTELSPELRIAANEVAVLDSVNYQALLLNKFCGIKPKGVIDISGAFFDTTVVKPKPVSVLVIHGMLDGAIPYGAGNVFYDPNLPKVYGPGVFIDLFQRNGIPVEADIYPNGYHVPVLLPFGDNLEYAIEQLLLTGSPYVDAVMDSTKRHAASFLYRLMGSPLTSCVATGIRQNVFSGQLQIIPNPSNGQFRVELPQPLRNKRIAVDVYDISGRVVFREEAVSNGLLPVDISDQPSATYFLSVRDDSGEEIMLYFDKLVKQ